MILAYSLVCLGAVNRMPVFYLAIAPIVISPVCMYIIRQSMEYGRPSGMFDPRTQSWAFLFGDTIALPLTFLFLAIGWRQLDSTGWYKSNWWYFVCLVLGVLVACGWHFLLDGPGYTADGFGSLLGSPSKLWHDFTVYGSISGALFFLGIPMLRYNFVGYGGLALLSLVVLWGGLGVADNTIHKLNPANLHPPASQTRLG